MELKDLKKTWDKMSPANELDEKQLKSMLSRRTMNLIDRIERNIRIGFMILLALFLIIAFDEYILSPRMLNEFQETYTIPGWLLFISVFSYILLFTTYIYFVIKYYRVKKSCMLDCNLADTVKKIMETLNLYRKLFYLALGALTISFALGFIGGLYQEAVTELSMEGKSASEIMMDHLLLQIAIGLVFLVIIIGGIFLFLRWGFRRLYGNYIKKLDNTLKEIKGLDETGMV